MGYGEGGKEEKYVFFGINWIFVSWGRGGSILG